MGESVDIVVKAHNEASAGLDSAAKSLSDLNQETRKTQPSLASLGKVLAATPLGKYSTSIGNVAINLANMREMLKQASTAGLAFKAALAGTAIALGAQVGTMIADWIFQTEKWKGKLAEALEEAGKIADRLAQKRKDQFKQQLELANTEATPEARSAALDAMKQSVAQQIQEQQRAVVAAREAAAKSAGSLTDKGKAAHDIDQKRLEIERERLDVLREQAAEINRAQRGPSDAEAELERRKQAAEQQKRIDAERRQTADEMWKREAEEQAKQQQREKNAADGARRLREELQARFRAIRDDGLAKEKEAGRQAFIAQMEWEMAEEEKYIDLANKTFRSREKEKKKKKDDKEAPDLMGFDSRLLSRGTTLNPQERVAKNTEETNKKLARQEQQMIEMNRHLGRIAAKTAETEGF